MAVFRCVSCGGDLDVTEGVSVCECEYCGVKQSVPDGGDEKRVRQFNRANTLRLRSEFDAAANIYQSIVSEAPEDAEAYWGLCLCRFGIEYVEDPVTHERKPTCHRTEFESIFTDPNYINATKYSVSLARHIYEAEAAEIDRIQKEILALVKNEEPYDIFICYKETDENGRRTMDSVLGQDIYDALSAKGYKVFFARITLEDKLGAAYEPCIFSALHTSKVMLALATRPEYFNAVWVKNEWSRFLDMMKKDRSKVFIPCYKDMFADEMPNDFKNIQAQDMGKIGFMQDLVRGVGKIIPPAVQQTVVQAPSRGGPNVENLLKRGFIKLEEAGWDEAKGFFERVLDEDAEEGRAYLGLLLAELRLTERSGLAKAADRMVGSPNYKNAVRYGGSAMRAELEGYAKAYEEARSRAEAERREQERLEAERRAAEEQRRREQEAARRAAEEQRRKEEAAREEEERQLIEEALREEEERKEAVYQLAMAYAAKGENYNAIKTLRDGQLDDYKDYKAKMRELWRPLIAHNQRQLSGDEVLYCVKPDGTVYAGVTPGFEKTHKKQLAELSKIKGACGVYGAKGPSDALNVVVMKNDGTAQEIMFGSKRPMLGKTADFKNMVKIAAAWNYTIGMRADGLVMKTSGGRNSLWLWKDIVDIASLGYGVVGVKRDGTLCGEGVSDLPAWTGLVGAAAGKEHLIGLKADGTVVAQNRSGRKDSAIISACDVSGWREVVAVTCGTFSTFGLRSDGTLLFTGYTETDMSRVSNFRYVTGIHALSNSSGVFLLLTDASGEAYTIPSITGLQLPNVNITLTDPTFTR